MSKYDEILNELVYQIDDLVYDFYSKSNELIANKKDQERLLTFRDKTLNTINEMNVRSLEKISEFRSDTLIRERAEHLITKNEELIQSALEVINSSADKSEILEDIQTIASGVYASAKDVKRKIDESGVIDKAIEKANVGIDKAKEGLEELSKDPRFIRGTEIVKEKSKEAFDYGNKIVKEGTKKVADYIEKKSPKNEDSEIIDIYEDVKEAASDVKEVAEDTAKDVKDTVSDSYEAVKDSVEEAVEETHEIVDDFVQEEKSETEI